MKKSILLILLGSLNLIHGIFHVLQFLQSIFLVAYSMDDHHSWVEELMHSPIISLIWAIIGIVSLIIGIRDYRHHKKCE